MDGRANPSQEDVSPRAPPSENMLSPAPEPCLLKAAARGKLIDVSTRTVWRMDSARLIPRAVLIGNTKRWRRAEIFAWVDAGCPDRRRWDSMQAHRQPWAGR